MAVKDLVRKFEDESQTPSPPHVESPRRASVSSRTQHPSPPPQPQPARFLHHPLLRSHWDDEDLQAAQPGADDRVPEPVVSDPSSETRPPVPKVDGKVDPDPFSDTNITHSIPRNNSSSKPSRSITTPTNSAEPPTYPASSNTTQVLPPKKAVPIDSRPSSDTKTPSSRNSRAHNRPPARPPPSSTPKSAPISSSKVSQLSPTSPATTAPATAHHYPPHNPVPTKTLFSRTAPPLSLPSLDRHLSGIKPPIFSTTKSKIFPPLGLQKPSQPLSDLIHNSQIAPFWKNHNTIFASVVSGVLGIGGSSLVGQLYSLQTVWDSFQVFALILDSVVDSKDVKSKWEQVFVGTIPNILALSFASLLPQETILLAVVQLLSLLLFYFFYRLTRSTPSPSTTSSIKEGLQPKANLITSARLMWTTFGLITLYLPVSTIAVRALIWTSDFWPSLNTTEAYTKATITYNATTRPPWHDVCYTTVSPNSGSSVNLSPLILITSVLTVALITIAFPLLLTSLIQSSLPHPEPYNSLGKRRSEAELQLDYQRLLERDKSELGFLYSDYRRRWGTYQPVFLFMKLTALLIVTFFSPTSCLPMTSSIWPTIQQSVLLAFTTGGFVLQSVIGPFIDPVSNASEWVSRVGYVGTAVLGLIASVAGTGSGLQKFVQGPGLYIVYVFNYGLNIYFTIISTSIMKRFVKRMSRRIDFSIDIFSPHLDVTPHSPHLLRRIWQESLLILVLIKAPIPKEQTMEFAEEYDKDGVEVLWGPWLLDFKGSGGERLVENLKILRELGPQAYADALELRTPRVRVAADEITSRLMGPDVYWKDIGWGNAWWIPFPPSLVIQPDEPSAPITVLRTLEEFEEFIAQNDDAVTKKRRWVRWALRGLHGRVVRWSYTHVELVGSRTKLTALLSSSKRQYQAHSTTHFRSGKFTVVRAGSLPCLSMNLASGFQVRLDYSKDVHVDGSVIGLENDFDLTPSLAKFLMANKTAVDQGIQQFSKALDAYRSQLREEMELKEEVMGYNFLTALYDNPMEFDEVLEKSGTCGKHVYEVLKDERESLTVALERLRDVSRDDVCTWWYLFWDDFYRRNHDVISPLATHRPDFDPSYPSSVAYNPLPRPALEAFLNQRGLWNRKTKFGDFITTGFLNKMYFRLNQLVYHGSNKTIMAHIGDAPAEIDIADLNLGLAVHGRSSTLGTGGGTDHDDLSIRARPAYQWEDVYDEPIRHDGKELEERKVVGMFKVWFGITPLERTQWRTRGVAVDVVLKGAGSTRKYIRLKDDTSNNQKDA